MLQARSAGGEKVVAFRPPAFRPRRERPADDAVRGRILLFTGVRYERMDDGAETSGSEPEIRVKRDDDVWA
jgi:hypothetical protein